MCIEQCSWYMLKRLIASSMVMIPSVSKGEGRFLPKRGARDGPSMGRKIQNLLYVVRTDVPSVPCDGPGWK